MREVVVRTVGWEQVTPRLEKAWESNAKRDSLVNHDSPDVRYNDVSKRTRPGEGSGMTTLRDWLDRLEEFDPDDWGEISKLRATSSEAALDTDLEAEITFRTEAGTVDRVAIRLIDESDQAVIELEYDILQLDSVVVAAFIQDGHVEGYTTQDEKE